jgi:hypothetical protein
MNQIEEAFSKVKGLLRTPEAQTREALSEAMGGLLDEATARKVPAARGSSGCCGYRQVVRLL